jgi:hypothetical protein
MFDGFGVEVPVVGAMALLYGLFLRRKRSKQLLSELKELSRTACVSPLAFAFAYLGLGDDQVFEWLDKAIDARDPIVNNLPSMPIYDGICASGTGAHRGSRRGLAGTVRVGDWHRQLLEDVRGIEVYAPRKGPWSQKPRPFFRF